MKILSVCENCAYAKIRAALEAGREQAWRLRNLSIARRKQARRSRRLEMSVGPVVADEAGKLPDRAVTEVLNRVSGGVIVRISARNELARKAKSVGRR